jgi:hypothetical protein
MVGVAGVGQRQLAQGLASAVAHQPGRCYEALQWPVVAAEQVDAVGNAL